MDGAKLNKQSSLGDYPVREKSCKVSKILFVKLTFDLTSISFSTVLALGGIWILFFSDGFDDDDDQDGGGTMSPVYEPAYAGNPA